VGGFLDEERFLMGGFRLKGNCCWEILVGGMNCRRGLLKGKELLKVNC
jgi:hypothetical protein